jgi:branched-chain amino acid transport system substrate-binding protein
MRALAVTAGALALVAAATAHHAACAEPIRIALITDGGAEQASAARHGEQGFRLGLEYATQGTLRVGTRAIELTVADDGGDPQRAASLLAAAYSAGEAALAIAAGSSASALAMLPVAAEARKILLVAHAAADAITGGAGNRYVFRTAISASQAAIAGALAIGRPELNLSVVAPDTLDGHDAVAALRAALERLSSGVFFISTYFLPLRSADIGTTLSAQYDDPHGLHGASTLLTLWGGFAPPLGAIAATNPGRFGIRLGVIGELEANPPPASTCPAFEGVTGYFHTLPRNAVNDWLVARWAERFHEYPDGFAAGGMSAALAVAQALAAVPSVETEALSAALAGMSFATPKGTMVFRREDHQALQPLYHVRCDPQAASPLPMLVREIAAAEIRLPIGNR